jgi:hypothetical protein
MLKKYKVKGNGHRIDGEIREIGDILEIDESLAKPHLDRDRIVEIDIDGNEIETKKDA